MKNTLWLWLCLMASVASAQIKLSGTLTDKATSEQLESAIVYIPELKRAVTTANNGSFSFTDLPAGNYLLNIKYVGYASLNIPLRLFRDTSVQIQLNATAAELNDVVVTGISKATEAKESPVAITLVNEKDLQATTATNIVDAITKLPGISAVSTGVAVSKPVIRGLGYNRVVTLNDGFKQEGQQWGDEHGIEIDEASIGRVEILRGPGSLMYGGDAIAGVINFLPHEPVAEGKIAVNALLNYQSNNNLLSSSLMTAGNLKGYSWNIRGSNKTAGNYTNRYDGKVYNSGFREWNMNGGFGINKSWGYSNVSFSTFNQQIGFNSGTRDSSGNFLHEVMVNDSTTNTICVNEKDLIGYKIALPFQRVNHHRVSIQNKIFAGRGSITLNGGWQMNQRREFDDVFQPTVAGLQFNMHTATLDLQYHLPEMKEWNTGVGLSSLFQINKGSGKEFLIPDYKVFDYGVFAVTQKRFGKLLFEAGLRFDQRFFKSENLYLNADGEKTNANDSTAEQQFASLNKTFYNFSGSIGISYRANESWVIKLNVAKGFRSPTAAELSSNGHHEGTYRYEYGNSNLKPESGFQADAGIDYSSEHVNFNLTAFQNTILNYIYTEKLSSVSGGDSIRETEEGDVVSAFRFKQSNALLAGAELTMDIHPHPADWLHFENSFGYVYAVNLNQSDSSKYLPFTPPAHYRGELRFDIPKTGNWLRGLFAGVHFDYFFQQKHVLLQNNTETPTPDYALLGLNAGFDLYSNGRTKVLTVIVAAENLLNTAYQSHLSRLKYLDTNYANGKRGIWNAGRNFNVKIVFPLEFNLQQRSN